MKQFLKKIKDFDKTMHARMGVVKESRYVTRVGRFRYNTLGAKILLGLVFLFFLLAVKDFAAMEHHYSLSCASVACDNPFYQHCDVAPDICALEAVPGGLYGSQPGFFLEYFGSLVVCTVIAYILVCFFKYRWWEQ